jgi:hypothetical protein
MEDEPIYNLKDRFRANCLHLFVYKQLVPPKQQVIERRSAFKILFGVSPFLVSNHLLYFVVTH